MRVLFICTGNSFRSPVAEALTRKHHPGLEVESAGTDATDHIAENAKQLLREENSLQYVKPSPDQVSQRAIDEADRVVVMMPEHREYLLDNFDVDPGSIEVWNIRDPVNPGVEPGEAFQEIEEKVGRLEHLHDS